MVGNLQQPTDEVQLTHPAFRVESRSASDGKPLTAASVETSEAVEAIEDISEQKKASKNGEKDERPGDPTLPPAPYWKLYSGADRVDKLLILVGTFCAAANGAALPGFTLVFGRIINTIGSGGQGGLTAAGFESEINTVVLDFLYIAIGTGIASYFEVCFWMLAGARQARRLRERYVEAVLRQDITFFDTMASSGKLLQGVNEDSVAVQSAIGEKVGNFIHNIGTCVVGIIIAFAKGWSMTLVMIALVPVLASLGVCFATIIGKYTDKGIKAYAEANRLAQESLGNMRTVVAFNGQEQTAVKYSQSLVMPEKVGIQAGFYQGMILGCFNSFFMFSYALALWFGSTRILAGEYNGGQVLNVIFAALIGGFALGMAGPNIQYFVAGKSAYARMEEVIKRKPPIDEEDDGEVPEKVVGEVELRNINFYYPARPDVLVLRNFSLKVARGTSVALCGQSGSGKSTVVQLVERFYDPAGGQVLFDGHDIRSLNLAWYRSHVGLVSQEPTLFCTTIFANIAFGKPGATQEEIEAAARTANAHGFISQLPLGYNTSVGEKGIQLSGGQKQRIAIARAILKNPQVVLLDEATSALDNSSERLVQLALDRLNQGRTTIVIAHRLSTIIHSDQIAVVREGEIVEQGSHEELIGKENGAYATLVGLQMSALAQKDGSVIEAATEDPADEELIQMASKRSLGDSRRSLGDAKRSMDGVEVRVVSSEEDSDEDLKAKQTRTVWDRLLRRNKAPGKQKEKGNASFTRLLAYNRPELLYALPGCIASGILGAVMPGFALAISTITSAFFSPSRSYLKHTTAVWCGVFAAIGFAALVSGMVQGYCFTLMGARLTRRIRVLMMRSLMRQDMAFFDKEENSSGSLTARLGVDTTSIRGAVGDQMGIVVQNLVTFIMGYIIAFTAGWKMTLVITAVLPILVFATYTETKFMQGFSDSAVQLYDAANQAAADAFGACRTVAAFSLRTQLKQLYSQLLDAPEKATNKRAQASGLGYGFSQFCMMAIYALGFWYGGKLIVSGEMTFEEMLKVFFAILLAAMGISQARLTFPDISKAAGAIQRVFAVIDRPSPIDSSSPDGDKLKEVRGDIELRSVRFIYPERPEVVIFQDFSLRVDAGRTVALCGQSGSGKSSIVALVQRLYDPLHGSVLLDGVDIRTLNLRWLRSTMAVVAQEPVLFTGSIMDNIRYGRPDASLEEVQEAARLANALSFIEQAPQGFDTPVGDGGVQLSGGQRQRVAIARAVIIDPKILLLDEATSALDASSEKLVQAALDQLMEGRTTLVVAHRLSTIRNADNIAVLQEGKILEQGSHDELISRKGAYRALISQQQRA